MMQSRTHNCGELRLSDAGKSVTIVGWLENVREVGANFAFCVLRDFYGTTQVVIETEEMMEQRQGHQQGVHHLPSPAPSGSGPARTPSCPPARSRWSPPKSRCWARCRSQRAALRDQLAPRTPTRTPGSNTAILDLRNPAGEGATSSCAARWLPSCAELMTDQGFLEITTPILTASSPEGARDYLVPARNHPGKFYALPQAPQQFKQLLMTSGFDRYFQIAPCFRDEDARADRSPGEFYQLDMEMAFASQEDVFSVLEDVLPPVFAQVSARTSSASTAPFRRIPYHEAMERYGSDKPDLRIDLEVQDVTADWCRAAASPPSRARPSRLSPWTTSPRRPGSGSTSCWPTWKSRPAARPAGSRWTKTGDLTGGISKFLTRLHRMR